jgi:SPP1 gp7 family putative phage head morphogenesis protein
LADPSLPALTEIARQLAKSLGLQAGRGDLSADVARLIVGRYEPLIARTFRDALLASWLDAARQSSDVPGADDPTPADSLPPLRPPFGPPSPDATPEPEPVVRLPLIEEAARDLVERRVMTPDDLDWLDQDARRTAFTLARTGSLDALTKINDALAENTRDGGTLRDFRDRVQSAVGESMVSPSKIEAVYRTNIGKAYSAGQIAILNDPLVSDQFPYVAYHAVHDSRTDPDHIALESMGLDGTNIYRTDDPAIQKFWPPWRWNCRCQAILISVADAAWYGVSEAKKWLETGEPPVFPQWVTMPPFELPPGWVPVGSRIKAVF